MWRIFVVSIGACVGFNLPCVAVAQISHGDRVAVVNDDVPKDRDRKEVGKLKKGEIVTAEEVLKNGGFTWIKIVKPAGEWWWVYENQLRRVETPILEGDHLRVVNETVPVFREKSEVAQLKKGEPVKAEKLLLYDGFEWVKVTMKTNQWGWVHARDLDRNGLTNFAIVGTLKPVFWKENPPVSMAAHSESLVEDTVTVKHTVKVSERWKIQGGVVVEVKAGLVVPFPPAVLGVFSRCQTEIRGEIEKYQEKIWGEETTQKRSVKIIGGNAPRPVKVVWEKLYLIGTATILEDGKENQVPFEFWEDFRLRTEAVDPSDVTEKPAVVLIGIAAFVVGIAVGFILAVFWLRRGRFPARS